MSESRLEFRSTIAAPASEVYRWHLRPGALQRLIPPWESVEIQSSEPVRNGSITRLRTRFLGIPLAWVAEHYDVKENSSFKDRQQGGPFKSWIHHHSFESISSNSCDLVDELRYELPFGAVGNIGRRSVQRRIQKTFAYRHQLTQLDLVQHRLYSDKPLRWLIAGSTGLIGQHLIPFLTTGGHDVSVLTRPNSKPISNSVPVRRISWNPHTATMDLSSQGPFDIVLNLAGENIASGRWTAEKKARIRTSRIGATRLLATHLSALREPPSVFLSASAAGFYGSRGDEILSESLPAGDGFLCEVCREWEQSVRPAQNAGIRCAVLRFGVVLSPDGGALAKMIPIYKAGGGGRIGSGQQYMSWISLDDVLGALLHVASTPACQGPINFCSANPVRQWEFAKTLANCLNRPAFMPLPAVFARIAFGEMADEALLSSMRMEPKRLLETNYRFRDATLAESLSRMLGHSRSE